MKPIIILFYDIKNILKIFHRGGEKQFFPKQGKTGHMVSINFNGFYAYIYIHTYVYMHVCVQIHVYMYVCTCTRTHIYVYPYNTATCNIIGKNHKTDRVKSVDIYGK